MSVDRIATALSGRFTVVRELGRGGMGVVLLAQDRYLDRPVAIKVLTPELSQALGLDRFTREIRLTARLVHPNIVPLFDSGQAADCLYYVMPFIDGETLRARLRQGPLPVAEVVRIVGDLAEALAYAHSLGVIHRDLKPDNVFWYGGRALLADFGVATTTERLEGGRTAVGLVVGTSAYMSPEQALGSGEVDARSDLYSVGCVMFELLAGEPPFGGSPMAIVSAQLATPAPSVAQRRPDVPGEVAALVRWLLAREPEARPPTAAVLIEALRSLPAILQTPEPTRSAIAVGLHRSALPLDVAEPCRLARSLLARAIQGGDGSRAKLEMARVYVEKALRLAPDHPHVMVALGDVLYALAIREVLPFETTFPEARALWMRALAADDELGEVHTSLGAVFFYHEDDFETAGIELEKGARLAPDHAMGRRYHGVWLKVAGRPAEALSEMRAAIRLEPAAPFMKVGLADVLMTLGRYAEAVDPLREALRLQPRYDAALERLEISCHRSGRHDEARDARRTLLGVRGDDERIGLLDRDVAELGWVAARERDLRRDLERWMALAEQRDPFVDPGTSRQLSDQIVVVLAELGEWRQAMDWIERGYHRRPGRLRRVLADLPYGYHGLALDPRFTRLLKTAGLSDLLFWESRFDRLAALLERLEESPGPEPTE